MGLCQAPCTASHSSWEPSSQRGDPVGIGGPWVWARSSAPAPPGAVLMFRLDFGYSCALDSGACGQAGALGTALLHGEWEGVGTQPMAPTAQEMRVLSLGKCFPAHPGRSAHAFPPRTAGGFRPRKPREQQLYVNHSGTGCQGIPTRIGKGLSAPAPSIAPAVPSAVPGLPIPLWANPLLFLPAPGDGITSSQFGVRSRSFLHPLHPAGRA